MDKISSRFHVVKNCPSKNRNKALFAAQCRLAKQLQKPNLNEAGPSNLPNSEEGTSIQEFHLQVSITNARKLHMFSSDIPPGEHKAVSSDYLLVHKSTWCKLLQNMKYGKCHSNGIKLQMRKNKGLATKLLVKYLACDSVDIQ